MGSRIIGIIPDKKEIGQSLRLAEEYGVVFEYNDFMLPQQMEDSGACRERIAFYRSLGRDLSRDTMHGAFLDITIHSQDPWIRRVSEKRIRQSMETAQELGVRGVVFHTGLLRDFREKTYRENWLKTNAEFWSRILEDYPKLEVYMENMFDEDETCLVRLGGQMKDSGRFGICLDYAHAAAFGTESTLERWMEETAPLVRHMHINDNDLKEDLHLPVGDGKIDWRQFGRLMETCRIDASVLLEVSGWKAQEASLHYIREHQIL